MTITATRSSTVITGDGQTSLPDTDVILIDGVARDRSGRQTSSSTRPKDRDSRSDLWV
jgi:hypothetical protein